LFQAVFGAGAVREAKSPAKLAGAEEGRFGHPIDEDLSLAAPGFVSVCCMEWSIPRAGVKTLRKFTCRSLCKSHRRNCERRFPK
jgi:hypothetical protein